MAFRNPKIVLIVLQLLAFWSVWRWCYLRLSTSSDETFGVLALIAAAVFCFANRAEKSFVSNFNLIFLTIIIYAVSFPFLPPLLRAVVAVTSLTFAISGWFFGKKFHPGIWSLFLLCLPSIASMQFYLGFPMRVLIGEATAFLLKLNGLVVYREGVSLHFGEQLIWIDAPCSGVKMLWTGFFLAALLITIYRFNFWKTFLALILTFGIILLGNIFRAVGLFYLEAGLVKMPVFSHEAIGVSAFVLTCIGIVIVIRKLSDRVAAGSEDELAVSRVAIAPRSYFAFTFACLFAFSVPFFVGGKESMKLNLSANFPNTFEGKPLIKLELTEREQFFSDEFPGEIRRFTDGNREIIIRYVTNATRKLHLSSDCFLAIGYQIKPLPIKIDESEQKWSCFNAKKGEENLKVCERIYTENGESWTDVSAWYWSALSSEDKDYWAVTVAETAD